MNAPSTASAISIRFVCIHLARAAVRHLGEPGAELRAATSERAAVLVVPYDDHWILGVNVAEGERRPHVLCAADLGHLLGCRAEPANEASRLVLKLLSPFIASDTGGGAPWVGALRSRVAP